MAKTRRGRCILTLRLVEQRRVPEPEETVCVQGGSGHDLSICSILTHVQFHDPS